MTSLLRRARLLPGAALLLAGLLALGGCEDPTGLGGALPTDASSITANYVDTFTVRTSTVLTDSVPSSTSAYLLLGRYHDARLGTVTARSYAQLGLSAAFTPEPAAVFDSLQLELAPDTYRYGDTTRTQTVQVHRLLADLRGTGTYYTADARPYDAAVLGQLSFRSGQRLRTLRIPLAEALGRSLLAAGQQGRLSSFDELLDLLPGLVLTPAAADDAALLRFAVAGSALKLYYHLPTAPDQALSFTFAAATGPKHFYQLEADRRGSLLTGLTATRQAVSSRLTAEETYVQAGLGLQTKVEFPYLLDLKQLGGNLVINAATLETEVVADSENGLLPPPVTLVARLSNAANHSGAYFPDASGNYVTGSYKRATSPRTGLDRGTYHLSLTTYLTQTLARNVANGGILLGPTDADVAERVVLGSARNSSSPMRLRVYFTRVGL
jgi:hypothetical protein